MRSSRPTSILSMHFPPAEICEALHRPPEAIQLSVTDGSGAALNRWDGASIANTVIAARKAHREAGIREPRAEPDLAEPHDCFSITELVTPENLGLSHNLGVPPSAGSRLSQSSGSIDEALHTNHLRRCMTSDPRNKGAVR